MALSHCDPATFLCNLQQCTTSLLYLDQNIKPRKTHMRKTKTNRKKEFFKIKQDKKMEN